MSLKSVQVYSVNEAGILTAIPNFIFKTDSTGSAILGGCCSNITSSDIRVQNYYTDYIDPKIATDGFGQWNAYEMKGTSSAIVGGANNCTLQSEGSFIGAGQDNFISGRTLVQYVGYIMGNRKTYTLNHGSRNFIGGGTANTVCSSKSVIVGGHGNIIKGISFCYGPPYNLPYSTSISGEYVPSISPLYSDGPLGLCNILNGPGYNGIVGGKNNCINAIYSIIGGGYYNRIISNQEFISPGEGYGFIGSNNSGKFDFIGGGECNSIENSCHSSILGGKQNTINLSHESVLLGGFDNKICKTTPRASVDVRSNVLVGGSSNEIYDDFSQFIGGGSSNFLSGVAGSAILGGFENRAYSSEIGRGSSDSVNAILGGSNNTISGGLNIIVGGIDNTILGTCCSAILGGHENTITSRCSTVIGGSHTSAIHIGSTIIGDTLKYKTSAGPHTLTLNFASGIVLRAECVPLTHTSNGYSGQIAFDTNYLYRHNGNYWTRTAMSTW